MVHENIIFGIDIAKGSLHAREGQAIRSDTKGRGSRASSDGELPQINAKWYGKINLR